MQDGSDEPVSKFPGGFLNLYLLSDSQAMPVLMRFTDASGLSSAADSFMSSAIRKKKKKKTTGTKTLVFQDSQRFCLTKMISTPPENKLFATAPQGRYGLPSGSWSNGAQSLAGSSRCVPSSCLSSLDCT